MVWRPGNEAMGHSVKAWERGYGTWCGGLGMRLWDIVWRPGNEAMGHGVGAWERGYETWCGGLGMGLAVYAPVILVCISLLFRVHRQKMRLGKFLCNCWAVVTC